MILSFMDRLIFLSFAIYSCMYYDDFRRTNTMKYTLIGSLKVSQICLGCMIGDAHGMHSWTLSYEDSKKIIFHALEFR